MPEKSAEAIIEIVDMHKWFGAFHVLKNIHLQIAEGERIVICGPSGSGKSTLIRCINHLEHHQRGTIRVDGTELTAISSISSEIRSEVGMVFQHFNLFPHLTVLENCTLAPIWVRKTPKGEAQALAMRYLERVQIPGPSRQISWPVVRRSAAARRHCAVALHAAEDHALRRADVCSGSGDD